MAIELRKIIDSLEKLAPPSFQESYDNSGLLIGSEKALVEKALICLDITEEIIDEAIAVKADLIIAHHPLIFKGIKRLNGKTYTERCILKSVLHSINIYCIHTNLDNVVQGSNLLLAEKLGLENLTVLEPLVGTHLKLAVFCPTANSETVRNALFDAGAGNIGNYDHCSYVSDGIGTYRAGEGSNPFKGKINDDHQEKEQKIEVIFPKYLKSKIIKAMLDCHPYEEVAYDLFALENTFNSIGSGILGKLKKSQSALDFLHNLKAISQTKCIRHTKIVKEIIETVAICGGTGSFLLSKAKQQKADIFITADVKYHEFFDAENELILADIGHYESEFLIKDLLFRHLTKNFATFAVQISEHNTNPVNYL